MNNKSDTEFHSLTLDDLWLYATRLLKRGDPVPVDIVARLNDAGFILNTYN